MIALLGIALALGLGVQIGGNSGGVSTGVAFGARLLSPRPALLLAAAFSLAGALAIGPRVTHTVGHELITAGAETHFLLTVPLLAGALIGGANALRLPISTTQAVVAGVIGVGAAIGTLDQARALSILGWWAATPLAAALLAYVFWSPLARRLVATRLCIAPPWRRPLKTLILTSGAYVAFSVGANNAANVAGPLSRGLGLDPFVATALGGAAMSAGMLLLGHRVMKTVGEGVTNLCAVRGAIVAVVSGTILIVASLLGVPVSFAQTITGALIGISLAGHGAARTWRNGHVRRIAVVWTASPFAAAGLSFLLAGVRL